MTTIRATPLTDPVTDASGVRLTAHDVAWLEAVAPVRVLSTDGAAASAAYEEREVSDGTLRGRAHLRLPDGTAVDVEDVWSPTALGSVRIARSVKVTEVGTAVGYRVELELESAVAAPSTDWQFFIAGALYNRNDTDGDGREDYLGTYLQEYRDDRNGHLAVLAYLPSRATAVTIARVTAPRHDTAVDSDQLSSGVVVQRTEVGSLGILAHRDDAPLAFRAGYPFAEEVSFSLDTSGRGWAAYLPIELDSAFRVEYEVRIQAAPDLTEAIWQLTRHQTEVLETRPTPLPAPMAQLAAWRFDLTQAFYRDWPREENQAEPAGYMTHFSPREGRVLGSLVEFGFTGAQSLHALTAIRRGYRDAVPLWITRARSVLDFFVRELVNEDGYADGIYDTNAKRVRYWFTGILLPFQYAEDRGDARRFLGREITDALGPIADELRELPGNYTRTMCEGFYPLLLAYEEELEHGVRQSHWLDAAERFGRFLLRTQEADGSWARGYSPAGRALTTPAAWFGANAFERSSGTVFPPEVLAALYRITGDPAYREALVRGAEYIARTFVPSVGYLGGLNDTTHIKSVKIDSVGVMFALRALRVGWEASRSPELLAAAVKTAKVLCSWLYLWDVPFPAGTLLAEGDFRTTGWAVCDVIPAGSYVDDEFLEFLGDLLSIARDAGLPELADYAHLVAHGMQQGLSVPGNMLGYAAPGIQCEGYMTAYYLAAPDSTTFSGAAAKAKGTDNDTCNGLVNAQAQYGLADVEAQFGTIDFEVIRQSLRAGELATEFTR